MDFTQIKPLVQRALSTQWMTSAEQEAVRSAVMSDTNKERANLLLELLGYQSVGSLQD